jgi:type I restriction enzyme S subunit
MKDEWTTGTLGDLADLVMGQSPTGDQCNEFGKGIPLLNGPTEFGGNHPKPVQFTTAPCKLAEPGDLLFCVRGSTTGRMNWADQQYAIGRGLAAIRSKHGSEYRYFIRAVVDANLPRLLAAATGSTFPSVSRDQIQKIECVIPPLAERKKIASVLMSIDEKIELNSTISAKLEIIARSFFNSWFVDFDAVRAKLDGSKQLGIDEETAKLFPNAFQESEMGRIPKGWDIQSLDTVANYLNGLALQKYPPGDGPTFPVVKIAQLRKGDVIGADRCNTELPQQYVVEDGDVLFSWSGSLEVELWCGGTGALNQHLFKVSSSEFPKWFYYLWTLHHLDEFRLIAASKATTMGHIQRSHITDAKVVVPPRNLLDAMTHTMSPIIDQIIANRIQSRTLSLLRDALLPKLLNGELSVENLQA